MTTKHYSTETKEKRENNMIEIEGKTLVPTRECTRCHKILPITKFLKTGAHTRRHVCNHCFYLYTVRPSIDRAIIRKLEERKKERLAA